MPPRVRIALVGLVWLAVAGNVSCVAMDARTFPDVVYGHKYGMALTMDVFQPTDHPNGAGIIFIVSGGWRSRWHSPEKTIKRFRPHLEKGFTVFIVRHGSSPKYNLPEIVQDVRRAVRYIRLHAADYGVDPDRLGVYGASAGGHLALLIGTAADKGDKTVKDNVLRQDDRVAAVVAYYPPTDIRPINVDPDELKPGEKRRRLFPALIFDSDKAAEMSPIVYVTPDDPPTLLIHGDKDRLVPLESSERIYQAFQEKNVPTRLLVIEGAGHGFRGADARRAREAMLRWFEQYLLKTP